MSREAQCPGRRTENLGGSSGVHLVMSRCQVARDFPAVGCRFGEMPGTPPDPGAGDVQARSLGRSW